MEEKEVLNNDDDPIRADGAAAVDETVGGAAVSGFIESKLNNPGDCIFAAASWACSCCRKRSELY